MSNELTAEVKEIVKEDAVLQGMLLKFNAYCRARSSMELFKNSAISFGLIQEQKDFREFLIELTKIPKRKVITE